MKIKPLDMSITLDPILWSWMAIDRSGMMFICTEKPAISGSGWSAEEGTYKDLGIVQYEGDWQESLVEFDIDVLREIFDINED